MVDIQQFDNEEVLFDAAPELCITFMMYSSFVM